MGTLTCSLVAVLPANGHGLRDEVEAIGDTHDQIVLALIAVVASAVAALVFVIRSSRYAREGAEQATAANRAVNDTTPGQHRLYDLVDRIRNDVADLKAHQHVTEHHGVAIRALERSDDELHAKLDVLLSELRDHVEWEMTQKYGPDA